MVFRRGQSVLWACLFVFQGLRMRIITDILMAAAIDGAKVRKAGGRRKDMVRTRFVDLDTLTQTCIIHAGL